MKSFTYTDFFYRSTLYVALAVALTATLGSLYFSEVRHYVPCNLCWYQRICMYPLVVVIAVGLLRLDHNLPFYLLPLTLLGQGIATYHYLLEKTHIFPAPTSCQVGVPCTTPWINWAGFITIPFLSMVAFFIITICCLIALTSGEPELDEFAPAPWFQVATVIVVVFVVFAVIYQFDPVRRQQLTLTVPATGEMTPVNATATPDPHASHVMTTTSAVTASTETTDSIATAASVATTATTTTTTTTAANVAAVDPNIIAKGQQLFQADCSVCHGVDAQGIPHLGVSLVASAIIQAQSEADALAFIRKGRTTDDPANTTGVMMPPSGAHPELTDDDIFAIIAYLRSL